MFSAFAAPPACTALTSVHLASAWILSSTGLQGGVAACATLPRAQRSIPLALMIGCVDSRMNRWSISVFGRRKEVTPRAAGATKADAALLLDDSVTTLLVLESLAASEALRTAAFALKLLKTAGFDETRQQQDRQTAAAVSTGHCTCKRNVSSGNAATSIWLKCDQAPTLRTERHASGGFKYATPPRKHVAQTPLHTPLQGLGHPTVSTHIPSVFHFLSATAPGVTILAGVGLLLPAVL